MRPLRVYFVDDQMFALRALIKLSEEREDLEIEGYTTDPFIAEQELNKDEMEVDVAFLDIEMPGLNGFQLLDRIKGITEVVFVTSYIEHAPESYRKRALDFLLKPVSRETFADCIDNIREKLKRKTVNRISNKHYFFVQGATRGKSHKIYKDQLIYIEAREKYIKIHLTNDKSVVTYLKLSEILAEADYASYIRVSRSFVINIDYIKSIDNYVIILENGMNISVGKTYKKAFRAEFNSILIRTNRNRTSQSDPDEE